MMMSPDNSHIQLKQDKERKWRMPLKEKEEATDLLADNKILACSYLVRCLDSETVRELGENRESRDVGTE